MTSSENEDKSGLSRVFEARAIPPYINPADVPEIRRLTGIVITTYNEGKPVSPMTEMALARYMLKEGVDPEEASNAYMHLRRNRDDASAMQKFSGMLDHRKFAWVSSLRLGYSPLLPVSDEAPPGAGEPEDFEGKVRLYTQRMEEAKAEGRPVTQQMHVDLSMTVAKEGVGRPEMEKAMTAYLANPSDREARLAVRSLYDDEKVAQSQEIEKRLRAENRAKAPRAFEEKIRDLSVKIATLRSEDKPAPVDLQVDLAWTLARKGVTRADMDKAVKAYLADKTDDAAREHLKSLHDQGKIRQANAIERQMNAEAQALAHKQAQFLQGFPDAPGLPADEAKKQIKELVQEIHNLEDAGRDIPPDMHRNLMYLVKRNDVDDATFHAAFDEAFATREPEANSRFSRLLDPLKIRNSLVMDFSSDETRAYFMNWSVGAQPLFKSEGYGENRELVSQASKFASALTAPESPAPASHEPDQAIPLTRVKNTPTV